MQEKSYRRKVGIVTLPLHSNYGGIFQAWALRKYIEGLGFKAVTFDFDRPTDISVGQRLLRYPYRMMKKLLMGDRQYVDVEARIARHGRKIGMFVENYIRRRIIKNVADIKPEEFDFLVFGSDQIWRRLYWERALGDISAAFGTFVPEDSPVKLITYAASFGKDDVENYPPAKKTAMAASLKRFGAVSVREESGVEICREEFGCESSVTVDPTMLYEASTYRGLCRAVRKSTNRLTTYILDNEVIAVPVIGRVAELTGAVRRELNRNIITDEAMSPEEWLAGFRDADFVVTDSYHGTVFSIIFGKPFVVIDNPERGSARITELLKRFGLEHHLVKDAAEIESAERYDHTASSAPRLKELRQKSAEWLATALGAEKALKRKNG